MKKITSLLTILLPLFLIIPSTVNQARADWPQIPSTTYYQPYGNVVVHSDFRSVPQSILIRWSLTKDTWLQRLNCWTLDQSPMPVHIVLISKEKKSQIFRDFPPFTAPGAYFYDSNNNAFWFDDDISNGSVLTFLENGSSYLDEGGSVLIFKLMLEKLFRFVYEANPLWNTRELWGHNPCLLNAAQYAASRVAAKAGPPPPEFTYHRYFVSSEEVKLVFQMAGWPKEHMDRVPPPIPSPIITDPDRYLWYRNLGIIDRETAVSQIANVLGFFARGGPSSQELKNLTIRDNLQILQQICQTRRDC